MSVISYLESRASAAVLSNDEKKSIETSVATLASRIDSYFTVDGDGIVDKFRFGSSTRGTILPRTMDGNSDIDYMIVFAKGGFSPQTYLDRLKRFVEKRYSTSEIYQSSPTIVLELNHIKFDLVPALNQWSLGIGPKKYAIPNGSGSWTTTEPNDFNADIETKNKSNAYLIKPTVRLAKIWNASNGYVFDSYLFEQWIANTWFYACYNLKDYLFRVFDNLNTNEAAQWRNEKIARAKAIIANVRRFENSGMASSAENEVKKLIPTL